MQPNIVDNFKKVNITKTKIALKATISIYIQAYKNV